MKDTESEIDKCVASIGGVKVSDLYKGSPVFDNADYWFKQYNVVAELKCLMEDKGQDNKTQGKVQNIFNSHLYSRESKVVIFGTVKVNSSDVSEQCTKDIAEVYRRPIQGIMKKANKQIRETKVELKATSAHGLLIIINDKNTALDPSQAMWMVTESLRRDGFRSIDSVLYITLNLLASHPDINNDVAVWLESYRDKENLCSQELYDRLRTEIHRHWEHVIGEPIFPFEVTKYEFIHEISNKKT
jgi:hypothetical protein